MFESISFAFPYLLLALILVPILIFWYYHKHTKIKPTILFPDTNTLKEIKPSFRQRLIHVPFILRMLALSLLIIAIARPQSLFQLKDHPSKGMDIMIALDLSGSMLAEDMKPNRLEAAKQAALDFIEQRKSDNLGLVLFAGEAFTQCPLTTDHNLLKQMLSAVKYGSIEDGTAIGDGLSVSLNRLKESQAKGKVVILLTDGVNNKGSIAPLTAAEVARDMGIPVYTIGVGSIGYAPYPYETPWGIQYQEVPVQIDEEVLRKMSAMTGAEYFRSTDESSLQKIFHQINKMEKTVLHSSYYDRKKEEAFPLILLALLFVLTEILLRVTLLRTQP